MLATDEDLNTSDYRVRSIGQDQLRSFGLNPEGRYVGSKWGRYLRSTDTLYKLQAEHPERFVPLAHLAPVERGITTNCDDFFIVSDVSTEALDTFTTVRAFRDQFSADRSAVVAGDVRIIRRSNGEEFALEKVHLRPVLKSARDVRDFATRGLQNSDFAVFITGQRRELSPRARRYVESGERHGWHRSPSFEAIRENGGNWYTLRNTESAPILFVKTMQYNPVVLLNNGHLLANQRLYEVRPVAGVDAMSLCAVLNSTVFACERYAAVKALGREAAIDIEVFSANALRTPNIRHLGRNEHQTLRRAMLALSRRSLGSFLESTLAEAGLSQARAYVDAHPVGPEVWPDELKDADRQHIDEIVLRCIGVPQREVRHIREQMYNELVAHIRRLKLLELEAQQNRHGAGATTGLNPRQIADHIWVLLIANGLRPLRIPHDFVRSTETRLFHIPSAGQLRIVPPSLFEPTAPIRGTIGRNSLEFRNEAEAEYVGLLTQNGVFGDVPIPITVPACRDAVAEISTYIGQVATRVSESAVEITSSKHLQQRIIKEALRRITDGADGVNLQ